MAYGSSAILGRRPQARRIDAARSLSEYLVEPVRSSELDNGVAPDGAERALD
jgi:hypothetical protein